MIGNVFRCILIGRVSSHDGLYYKDNYKVIFVERKTGQSQERIANAVVLQEKYGQLVFCKYDDDMFKECVLNENKKQL